VLTALILVAGAIGVALILRPERASVHQVDPREVACIESGGVWEGVPPFEECRPI